MCVIYIITFPLCFRNRKLRASCTLKLFGVVLMESGMCMRLSLYPGQYSAKFPRCCSMPYWKPSRQRDHLQQPGQVSPSCHQLPFNARANISPPPYIMQLPDNTTSRLFPDDRFLDYLRAALELWPGVHYYVRCGWKEATVSILIKRRIDVISSLPGREDNAKGNKLIPNWTNLHHGGTGFLFIFQSFSEFLKRKWCHARSSYQEHLNSLLLLPDRL